MFHRLHCVLLLLLVFLGCSRCSFAATLDCQDSQSNAEKLACQLEVSVAELAEVLNLNCESTELGLVCNFETTRDVTTSSLTDARNIEACSHVTNNDKNQEEMEVCVHSETQITLLQRTKIKHNAALIKDNPQQQQNYHDNKDPANDSDSNVETSKNQVFSIKIGQHEYQEPFSAYAAPVATALSTRSYLWKSSSGGSSMKFLLATAMFEIGVAHFRAATNEGENPGLYKDKLQESLDLKLAENAFTEAERTMLQVLDTYTATDNASNKRSWQTTCASLGALYLQWGELYKSPHYFLDEDEIDEMDEDDEDALLNSKSLAYYEKAEMYYRQSLDPAVATDDENNALRMSYTINLAHVSHRIGRNYIRSLQGASISTILHDERGDIRTDALQQLSVLLTFTKLADEKFEEAERLYRQAIEEEKDFDARIKTKSYLATTLQDHGTALAYTSDLPKALKLQKEGIDVNKEIIPHMEYATRQFMIQYLGESMLSVCTLLVTLREYDEAKQYYGKTMDWFIEKDLRPPTYQTLGYQNSDEMLESFENQLANFHQMKIEHSVPNGYEAPMYTTNGAYEGYLHHQLGLLHLSRSENFIAADHFKQAISLYEDDQAGQDLDSSIATAKLSLATALLQNGEFAESAEVHSDAMDFYNEVMVDVKPSDLASLLEEVGNAGGDLSMLDSEEGRSISSQLLAEQLASLLVKFASKTSEMGTASRRPGMEPNKVQGMSTVGQNAKDPENSSIDDVKTETAKKPKQAQVHEELFDLEQIRKNALNISSVQEEL